MEPDCRDCLLEAAKGRHGGGAKGRVAVLVLPDDDPRLPAAVSRYLDRFPRELYYNAAVALSAGTRRHERQKFQL